MKSVTLITCLALVFGVLAPLDARGEDPKSAEGWLKLFSTRWDEEAWMSGRRGYMRPLDDEGWQARMLAIGEWPLRFKGTRWKRLRFVVGRTQASSKTTTERIPATSR